MPENKNTIGGASETRDPFDPATKPNASELVCVLHLHNEFNRELEHTNLSWSAFLRSINKGTMWGSHRADGVDLVRWSASDLQHQVQQHRCLVYVLRRRRASRCIEHSKLSMVDHVVTVGRRQFQTRRHTFKQSMLYVGARLTESRIDGCEVCYDMWPAMSNRNHVRNRLPLDDARAVRHINFQKITWTLPSIRHLSLVFWNAKDVNLRTDNQRLRVCLLGTSKIGSCKSIFHNRSQHRLRSNRSEPNGTFNEVIARLKSTIDREQAAILYFVESTRIMSNGCLSRRVATEAESEVLCHGRFCTDLVVLSDEAKRITFSLHLEHGQLLQSNVAFHQASARVLLPLIRALHATLNGELLKSSTRLV